jgi:hypothetical protein
LEDILQSTLFQPAQRCKIHVFLGCCYNCILFVYLFD